MMTKIKKFWQAFTSLPSKVMGGYEWLKEKTIGKLYKKFPGKKTIILERAIGGGAVGLLVLAIGSSCLFSPEDDTSSYNSSYSTSNEESDESSLNKSQESKPIKGLGSAGKRLSGSDPEPRKGRRRKSIKFQAKQVLVRNNAQGDRALPIGTNFVGKLLASVDSRHSDKFVRVLLPFGGKFKDRMGLPKNTVLLGAVSYPGNGKRLFIGFHTGVLPNGEEIKLSAAAMDSKDFSPGLIGRYHSAFGERAGATLGFAFASGASEVLQDKEALGKDGVVTKKSTLKNAMLNGISEFSKTEGAFQLDEVRGRGAYVTLNQGKELIVTLTGTYKKGEMN